MGGEDASYKIVLVGDSGVGKTNLLASFVARQEELKRKGRTNFDNGESQAPKSKLSGGYSELHQPTIGCEFYSASMTHPTDGSKITLQIWDTAGQERYRAITPGHYRRAAGALLVYDVTEKKSLESAIGSWYEELQDWPLSDYIAIVGNKVDLFDAENSRHVSEKDHVAAAKKVLAVSSNRTSAKTGHNVYEAFMQLVFKIHEANRRKSINHKGGASSPYDKSISLSYLQKSMDDNNPSDSCKCAV